MEDEIPNVVVFASMGLDIEGLDSLCCMNGPLTSDDLSARGHDSMYQGFPIGLPLDEFREKRKNIKKRIAIGLLLLPLLDESASSTLKALSLFIKTARRDWSYCMGRSTAKKGYGDYRIQMAMQNAKLAWKIINSLPIE